MWPSARRLVDAARRAAIVVAVTPALAATPPEPMLLALAVNGVEQPQSVRVLVQGERVALALDALQSLNMPAPAQQVRADGIDFAWLEPRGGLQWRIDAPTQTLEIAAPASAFEGRRLGLGSDAAPVTGVGVGGFLNYDLQWQRHEPEARRGSNEVDGLLELGGFSPMGHGRLVALARGQGPYAGVTRLDASIAIDRPAQMARLTLGDSIATGGAWGRALRFGGVQWSTDFGLRPGFMSFPLPTLHGEAALPSTVELYVDQARRLQSEVPAGAFSLTEVPIVTGEGQVRMVVRDVLGREQVVTQSYAVDPALLRPGLRAQSFELGALREDYALESDHYGPLYGAATDRLGITDTFTREVRAEFLERQLTLGAAGLWMLPGIASVDAAVAASHGPRGDGAMLSGGTRRSAASWSASLNARATTREFAQAGDGDRLRPRFTLAAAWAAVWSGTAVGANLVRQDLWEGRSHRLLGVNVSRPVGRHGMVGFYALRDLGSGASATGGSAMPACSFRTSRPRPAAWATSCRRWAATPRAASRRRAGWANARWSPAASRIRPMPTTRAWPPAARSAGWAPRCSRAGASTAALRSSMSAATPTCRCCTTAARSRAPTPTAARW